MFIEYLRDIGRSLSILADEGAQRLLSGWGAPLDQLADDARLALAYGRPYECPVEAEPIDLMCASSGLPRLHGQSVEDGRAQVLQRFLQLVFVSSGQPCLVLFRNIYLKLVHWVYH